MLTAEAALRSGAGLVSVATRAAHVAPLLARCPEAMTHAVEDGAALAPLLRRASVVALGPGLGQDEWAQGLWRLALAAELPLVIDADALNLLAQAPRALPNAVLTPHPGEAGRLLGLATVEVQRDRFAAAAALAERYQAAVVLKAFEIIDSAEGRALRMRLMTNVLSLRQHLRDAGMDYYGDPSAIVAVKMGTEGLARLVSRRLPELGLLANLVEYPAVGKGAARFRMQVMAGHSEENITDAVKRMRQARAEAMIEFQAQGGPQEAITIAA
jgi:hypothetical protein